MSIFKFVSLFSGIGGFDFPLIELGGECVMSSEIDKYAVKSYEAMFGSKPVGDVTKIDAIDVPDHDLLVGGFPCFAQGTLITTVNGLKSIEDIQRGEQVLTHNNTFKDVVMPMIKYKKGIFELKVQGSPKTFVTEEHPVYVREMSRLWDNEKRMYKRTWSDPRWLDAKDLQPSKHFIGFAENKNAVNPYDITGEEAWLLGRYVADGYLQDNKRANRANSYNHKIVFCVGKNKLEQFKNEVTEYKLGISEERTVYKVRIINERLFDLAKLCGKGAENKEVPSFVLDLPTPLLERFIDGYLSGDGSERNGVYAATTVSRKLVYSLGQAVQKVYHTPYSINFTKCQATTVIEGRIVNQRDTWTIRFSKEIRGQNNAVYIDGMLWMPVKSLNYLEDWEGNVYNLEVSENNSYVANNLTVHNCQAFSVAGKRRGFEDTRGTLFFEIARIAKVKRPKLMLMENVKGLVSHDKGNTLDVIIRTLDEIGYTVDFEIMNSKFFGVPQNRERIFIVAVRNDLIDAQPWNLGKRTDIIARGKKRIAAMNVRTFNFDWPVQDTVSVKLRDILEDVIDYKYYLSEDKTAKLITQLSERTTSTSNDNCVPNMLGHLEMNGHDYIKRVYSVVGVCPTLTTTGGGNHEPKVAIQQYSNGDGISHCVDANYAKGPSPSKTGKGVRTCILEEVRPVLTPDRLEKRQNGRRFKENDDESFTLTSQDRHGVAIGNPPRYRIRKLTPLECWRLQGFSDSNFDKCVAAGVSNSQLYKQAGNAVTIPVIKALGDRLVHIMYTKGC